MNEEIKEILDRLERINHKEYCCGFEFADSSTFDETCRCFEERKKFADYITNLQEENKHLDKVNCALRKNINNNVYKSRNEKAIEYIKPKFIAQGGLTSYEINDLLNDLLNILGGDKE